MKKIYIYVGENVCNLKFSCGGGPDGFNGGIVTYWTGATHRHLPETGLHPRKYAKVLENEIKYCQPYFDLHISTNSGVTINKIATMVRDGILDYRQIEIYVLSEDNQTVNIISTITSDGYLTDDWPYGFMCWYPEN